MNNCTHCEKIRTHVGAETVEEAWDVTLRTAAQKEGQIAEMFTQIKTLAKERAEWADACRASDEARAMLGAKNEGLIKALTEITTSPGRSCHIERIAKKALQQFGTRVIEV